MLWANFIFLIENLRVLQEDSDEFEKEFVEECHNSALHAFFCVEELQTVSESDSWKFLYYCKKECDKCEKIYGRIAQRVQILSFQK